MKNNEQQSEAIAQLMAVLTESSNQTRTETIAHSALLQAIFAVLSDDQKAQVIKMLQTATINRYAATAGVEAEVKSTLSRLLDGFSTPQSLN